jgi:predicted negative regulator of RcsB-dependent stress response
LPQQQSPTVVPTQTGGGPQTLPAFVLIGVAVAAGFYWWHKHKAHEERVD